MILLAISFKLNQFVDKGTLQIIGPRGIYDTLNIAVYNIIKLSTGSLLHFSIYLLSGIIFILLSIFFNLPLLFIFLIILII